MGRRLALPFIIALLIGTTVGLWTDTRQQRSAGAAALSARVINEPGLYIYIPGSAARSQPAQILVALHGMGGNGGAFCQGLLGAAERNGWIVVAPTFKYQDYKNPELVLQDDTTFLPRLQAILDSVPERTGLATREKALLYGHSRGGQAVHRFATFYPERTLGVAALSAGSYTLPLHSLPDDGRSQALPLPYGVANLGAHLGREFNDEAFKRVPFQIAIGGQDRNSAETPRAWDPYLGQTRVERATAYTKALQALGVKATLKVYPDAGHAVTPQMQADALDFLQGVVKANAAQFGSGPARASAAYGEAVTTAAKGKARR